MAPWLRFAARPVVDLSTLSLKCLWMVANLGFNILWMPWKQEQTEVPCLIFIYFRPPSLRGFFYSCVLTTIYGCFQNRGTPKWMVKIMENPIKMGWFGGKTHYFRKHPYKHFNTKYQLWTSWCFSVRSCGIVSPWHCETTTHLWFRGARKSTNFFRQKKMVPQKCHWSRFEVVTLQKL